MKFYIYVICKYFACPTIWLLFQINKTTSFTGTLPDQPTPEPSPARPRCSSLLHLFGPWLFEAAFIGCSFNSIFLYSWLFEAAFNGNLYNLYFIFMRWPFRSSIVACHSSAVHILSGCLRVRVCKIVRQRGRRSRDTILFKARAAEQQQHLSSETDVSARACVLSWAWRAA